VDSADYGMAVLDTNNILTYTPNPDYFGQDTIVITICDELFLCDNDTIIITINPVNDFPIAQNDSLIVLEDNLITQSVISNDIDVDDNVLTTSLISGSLNGLSTISTSGILSYMPNPDFFGVDSLTYSLCDDEGLCDTAWVFINVMAVNDIPVGIDDSYYTDYFIPLSDSVWANDYDVDGDTLLYTVLVNPMNGTVAMSTEGDFIYTPDALFTSNDTLYYTVCDADLNCDTVMVVITVGPIPDLIVLDDMFDMFEDETLTNTVVTNDTPDLTYTLLSTTLVGDLNFEIDGSFVYSPDTNYFGIGELVYIACNQYSFCDTATVYINVIPVNDAPIAAGDTSIVCGYSAISIDAFAYVTDVDGSDFIINSASSDQGLVTFDAQTGIIQFVPNVDIDSAYVNCEICDMGTPQLCTTAQWLFVFTHTQFTISASQQNLICEQDEASIMVTATGGSGNINYVWSNQATSATIDNLIAGDYSVTIEDALGCANDTTLNFIIPALVPFSVESTFKDATCNSAQNGEIDLSIIGGTTPYYILWNDGSEDSLRTGLVPELYSYIVQDANLCTREGVIEISVASNDCFLAVNGFSPDGDGLNETFVVLGLENYLDNHLVIVNRWGNTVFETEGYDNTWDGSLKTNGAHFGKKVPPGTYFYQLYITLLERTLSGFVTIKYAE
jgi:gliding motility-associated-like protein